MTHQRFLRLDTLMQVNSLDSIVLNPGPTLTYLTGLHFHLMERPTLFIYRRGSKPVLILPELEEGKVSACTIPLSSVTFGDDPATWGQAFKTGLAQLSLLSGKIGVEPNRLRFMEMNFLQEAAPELKFVSADNVFNPLRLKKDAGEIETMRIAVKIAQQALIATLPSIRAGTTEKTIAAELTIQLLKAGSGPELPFSPIVASGPNSANPHAVPTDRVLQRGDLVVIDWGASHQDYCSDLTRTFAIEELSEELQTIYATVRAANQAGRDAGKPNIEAGNIDKAARDVITKAGFGPFFTHRTGHGLGMEGHETPYIFGENTQPLGVGMVYTVEPGIYLTGKGGVRIEDDMVVTSGGCESLSDFSRDLIIL
jgi:Xaa-Pro dipeptidase